ncbi:hypothetical protein [aff. Roholtiella sp. LEGE 12411]|uniref:hypothetical protein n=1 Tax=aff. Roholtiella sp. LEGE 12411 TaxID=1828822 RepID=UPI00187E8BB1|nr:hypothetical protein [aff. Roholtiella sp. LEGE 12411]MBE9035837.1 hypothetical protein [aff. Roholtiella sp. LEGE 12411]
MSTLRGYSASHFSLHKSDVYDGLSLRTSKSPSGSHFSPHKSDRIPVKKAIAPQFPIIKAMSTLRGYSASHSHKKAMSTTGYAYALPNL